MLDVNAGFGPWLVDAERLHDAMNTGDWSGGVTRGLARFESESVSPHPDPLPRGERETDH